MSIEQNGANKTFARYPVSNIIIYNGVTILHYLLGGLGIILGFDYLKLGYPLGIFYMAFAFMQMYIIMPLAVCPNCVYVRMEKGRCTSGLNVFSRKITKPGNLEDFPDRAKGLFCHNNLYMAAKAIPILAIIVALVLNFSFLLLGILLTVVALLVFRIFVIFPRLACIHCAAKNECPNAQSMGLSEVK